MKLFITKQRSIVFFLLTIFIVFGTSNTGYAQAATIDPPLSERTPQIREAIVAAVPNVNAPEDVTAAHLAAITRLDASSVHLSEITKLDASSVSIKALKNADFSGLTALTQLYLYDNSITDISALKELTSLTHLYLYDNSITDITPLKGLTNLTRLELYNNAITDISALEDLTKLTHLWLFGNTISDISVLENLTKLTDLWLTANAISDTSPLEDLTTLKKLSLADNPISDYAPLRRLRAAIEAAGSSINIDVNIDNDPPIFTDGTSTTRTVPENTDAGTNIGTPVAATDANSDNTLTYILTGTDAASFSMDIFSGQLQTKAALDYETKPSYSVTARVFDNKGGTDTIDITINVTRVEKNRAPAFTDGDTTTRSVAENTGSAQDIGTAVSATDPDDDTLTYSLGGTDADAFGIDTTSGQLQTKAALNYETKPSYSVTVSVSDGKGGSDSIDITVNVTNVNEAPSFASSTATRTITENTAANTNIGTAIAATDVDANTTLTYTIGGTDAESFNIVSTSGQLQTKDALDFETDDAYSVTITATDGGNLSDTINVTITVTDANDAPTFTDGENATRTIAENTAANTNIGTAIAATDQDRMPDPNNVGELIPKDTLTYSLSGDDAESFSIDSESGQLQTKAALDYETDDSYSVTVSVSDGEGGTDSITVTITVTDVNEAPTFSTEAAISNISATAGTAITSVTLPQATDVDGNTLTYTLAPTLPTGLTFTAGTRLLSGTPTTETASATYTYTASDGTLSDTLTFTIQVSAPPNNAPVFADGDTATRSVAENTAASTNIGTAISATDADTSDTLTYSLSGDDAASFSIVETSGQLQTKAALNYETKTSYSVTVSVSDGEGGSDSITVTITVTDVNEAPTFSAEAAISNISATAGTAITSVTLPEATDVDGNTITYTLAPTLPTGLTFTAGTRLLAGTPTTETASATYTYTASDGTLSDTLTFTIQVSAPPNNAPAFADGDTATRSVAENTAASTNIGTAISATDADTDDTLTYTLSGDDAASFSIVDTSGQLQTKAALNYETKTSYAVKVSVSDGEGGSDSIDVTINVTDVNEAPTFSTEAAISNISATAGTAITSVTLPEATDVDGNTLTYTLAPTLPAGLTFTAGTRLLAGTPTTETASATYTYTASDGTLSDTLTFTIQVSAPPNNAPVFADGDTATRSIAENTAASTNIGTAISATDADTSDTLTYTLSGEDAASFSIVDTSGQLQTKAALNYETKTSYAVKVSVSDGEGGTDSIDVTINVTDVNEAPTFNAEAAISNISATAGTAITSVTLPEATDVDGNTITYTLAPTLPAGLTFTAGTRLLAGTPTTETASATYTYTASDGTLSDTLTFTIQVSAPPNNAPVFADGDTATRSVAENTAASTNIGTAISATDADTDDTLTYSLSGEDAASFSIVETSGQLQTKAALNYETKPSYAVKVSVSDGEGGSDSIDVTINVTDVNEAPTFSAEAAISNISATAGTAITSVTLPQATDVDGNTLTYTLAPTLPTGLTFTAGTRLLAGTPTTETASATYTYTASDGTLSDTLTFTIQVSAPPNNAPVFADGTSTTRSIAENTAASTNIGTAIAATDADNDTLTYSLSGEDAASFSIVDTSGQLQTKAALNYETDTSYSVKVSVSDGEGGTDSIDVTINITDVNEAPTFSAEAAISNISATAGTAITSVTLPQATDVDGNTITYTLAPTLPAGLTFTAGTRLLAGTPTTETASATYTYTASDGTLSDTLTFTIQVSAPPNNAPAFTNGTSTTRAVPENMDAGKNIGTAVTATDADTSNTLTYSLSGTDASSFSIDPATGQLQTKAALNYETKTSYSVKVSVSDGKGGTDSIDVTINVMNVNEAPTFTDGTSTTRTVPENTAANTNIGTAIAATDADMGDTLTYALGGTDADSFGINTASGQLQTKAALDYETDDAYSVTITATDGDNLSDTINVTITVTDVNDAPTFADGTTATRSVAENTDANTNIGTAIAATDQDRMPDPNNVGELIPKDTLTYSLSGTDATSFGIDTTSGQLQTKAALDYETKTSYAVKISVSDGEGGTDSINVTVNVTNVNEAPTFTDGTTATRTIAENTRAGKNIGTAVKATDVDANTTLTYSLGGTNAASFSIDTASGQLKTSAALNYETKTSYSVKVSVSDGNGGTDSIDVTINITDVYEPIIDRTKQVQDAIVAAVPGVNHPDYVTVAHLAAITQLDIKNKSITSLKAGDFNELPALTTLDLSSNSISNISVLSGLTKLTKLYLYGNSIRNISVLENLTKLTTLSLSINSISDISALEGLTKLTYLYLADNSISDISALEDLTKLTYLNLEGNSISDISALEDLTKLTQLQLSTNSISDISVLEDLTALTYLELSTNSISDISVLEDLTKLTNLYLSTNSISDISALEDLTKLTNLTLRRNPISDYGPLRRLIAAIAGIEDHPGLTLDINLPPEFTEGTSTTRSVPEYTPLGQDIGDPVSATDVDSETLTYSLGGTDKESFSIDTTTGQLQTKAALHYETTASYTVTVSVSDSKDGTDTITVTINVTDVDRNRAPAFINGDTTTRSVREDADPGENIGTPVTATDADRDTLAYSLGGTDAQSFTIDPSSGQLQTSAALDYEKKTSYSVTITVSDGTLKDSIAVTINVTDVNETLTTPVNQRTQQVQNAIVNAAGVGNADDVTPAHLAAITELNLFGSGITVLKSGDFSGLTALTTLNLSYNSISDISALRGLTKLTRLYLGGNSISDISALRGLTALADLDLYENSISDISALKGLTKLTILYLYENSISDISALERLTKLRTLHLKDNPISDYGPLRKLVAAIEGIEDHQGLNLDINIPPEFTEGASTTRSVIEYTPSDQDIGAPVSATDANSDDSLTYSLGGEDAESFSIDSWSGQLQTSAALNYQTKRSYSVTVSVSDGDSTDTITVTIYVTDVNEALITPVNQRTQQVQDAIVNAVYEVDNADDVTPTHLAAITELHLSYNDITALKSGDFSFLPSLTTLYLGGNSISDISTLRGLTKLTDLDLSDNSISDISALSGLTKLTTLNLRDNSISNISALSGLTALTQLSLSGNPISDYAPLRKLVAAIEGIEDHQGLSLDINIPPTFTEGTGTTRFVEEYTASGKNIGDPVSATDVNSYDSLTYSLGGTDAESFSINSESGQLMTHAALNYQTKRSYSVTVSVSDNNGGEDTITVAIYVRDVNEALITPVNQRTQQVQDAIVNAVYEADSADDVTPAHLAAITDLYLRSKGITSLKSGDFSGLTALISLNLSYNSISDISALEGVTKLTYLYLQGNPISDYAPLRRLKTAIENAGNAIYIDIDITNNPPQFTDGDSTTRTVSENMPSETNIGTAISATDADNDTLTYSLSGTDADAFRINSESGQLQTKAVLDYETETSYSVTVSVSDGNDGSDSITVTINVSDVDETLITPVNQRTQQVQDAIVDAVPNVDNADDVTPAHLAVITELNLSNSDITVLKSGDFSGLTSLTTLYLDTNNSISDISALEGLTALTNLYLYNNSISDISALEGLTKLTYLSLTTNSISDISALEGLTKLTTLSLYENSISDVSALEGLTALGALYLGSNPISDYAPLRRLQTAIENADNTIYIDIDITNNPPQFTDGDSTTRAVAENVAAGTNIGTAISATDADNDTLTYSLSGEDADAFNIVPTSGQLEAKDPLDYETQSSYTVTVTVQDTNSGGDRITVTINVTDEAGAAPSVEPSPIIPERTALLTNFPNPFNPETWIPYQLAKPAEVTLTIYDVRGVVVRELKLGHQPAGIYHSRSRAIHWDGRNAFGEKVATGLYFYTLKAGDYTATRKLLIRK